MYNFGAGYYDADIGLWTSVDPMRQHWSGYTYGSNNPINRIDSDGNQDKNALIGVSDYGEVLTSIQDFETQTTFATGLTNAVEGKGWTISIKDISKNHAAGISEFVTSIIRTANGNPITAKDAGKLVGIAVAAALTPASAAPATIPFAFGSEAFFQIIYGESYDPSLIQLVTQKNITDMRDHLNLGYRKSMSAPYSESSSVNSSTWNGCLYSLDCFIGTAGQ